MDELSPRVDDAELWRCVEATLLDVIIPAIAAETEWARVAAVQLVGLARYAQRRPGPDSVEASRAERCSVLRSLASNRYVAARWDGAAPLDDVDAVIADVLVDALGKRDADAQEIHGVLRTLLLGQLDAELVVTAPLVNAFRGRLDA